MKKFLFFLTSAIVLHLLIWEASLGVNALIFSTLIALGVAWCKPRSFTRGEVRALLGGWWLSGLFVTWHHSLFSEVVYLLWGFILLGYLQEVRVRFWGFGLIESLRALLGGWWLALRHGIESGAAGRSYLSAWRRVRTWLLPLTIVIPFYLIYSGANPKLGAFNARLWEGWRALWHFDFDASRGFVFLLGWGVVLAFLGRRVGLEPLHRWINAWGYDLRRVRRKPTWRVKTTALRGAYRGGVLTFLTLNALLLVINILDLVFVWLSPHARSATELSQYVHEGTWLLIWSIVLAMLVVLGLFRANLNFFPDNQRLRGLAYLWLAQNAFLALSVGVRNLRYIQGYGLAHGRVVVLVFLVLVLFGLYTMYRKVRDVKSIYYLLQYNFAAVLAVLLSTAAVNWDGLITRYNLRRDHVDTYYLAAMLDNNLVPLLRAVENDEHKADNLLRSELETRASRDAQAWENKDWRGWNYRDWREYRAWLEYLDNRKMN